MTAALLLLLLGTASSSGQAEPADPSANTDRQPAATAHPPDVRVVDAPVFQHPMSSNTAHAVGVADVVIMVELDDAGHVVATTVDPASHPSPVLRRHALQLAAQTRFATTAAAKVPLRFTYDPGDAAPAEGGPEADESPALPEPPPSTPANSGSGEPVPMAANDDHVQHNQDSSKTIEVISASSDETGFEDTTSIGTMGQGLLLGGVVVAASALFVSVFSGATSVDNATHVFDDDKSDIVDVAEAAQEHAFGQAHLVPVVGPMLAVPHSRDTTSALLAMGLGTAQVVGVGLMVAGAATWGTAWVLE